MAVIGIDIGGTKISAARFEYDGIPLNRHAVKVEGRQGTAVGRLVLDEIKRLMNTGSISPSAIGVSVPGISWRDTGTVWAPNIPGWERYPLLEEIRSSVPESTSVMIESDRSCYILGETWRGAAQGERDAIFIAVGTGIGAGIVTDGAILRGSSDIAGSIGWLGLDRPYRHEYKSCGCFEHYASGDGIARSARRLITETPGYDGVFAAKDPSAISCRDVFTAYDAGDVIAVRAIENAIELWGMAVANLVSIFNPRVIVFGGGVFGPAVRFLDKIHDEAVKWAQPISISRVELRESVLGDDAGLVGAGKLALSASRDTGITL